MNQRRIETVEHEDLGNWREEGSADGCTASNCECELIRMHYAGGDGSSSRCSEGQTENAGWNLDSDLEIWSRDLV